MRSLRARRPLLVAAALLILAAAALAASVERGGEPPEPASPAPRSPAATGATLAPGPALCGKLATAERGRVVDGALTEISGLVRSRRDPQVLWAVEDSGAEPVLAALSSSGVTLGLWTVTGATNLDWEALATGPGPGGTTRLYIGDIGDNQAQRDAVTVWVVDEPAAPRGGGTTAPAQPITLRYPGGARDAETLLIDPSRGDLVVVSKELTGGGIYFAPAPLALGGAATLKRIADAPLGFETAGDISADGRVIAVRGYQSLATWQRGGRASLAQTLRRKPCVPPTLLDDGQGETLALSRGGASATTIAEGERPPVLSLRGAAR